MPGFAAVVGALNDLAEPAAGLRGVDAVRIGGRSLQVINLPAGKVRSADVPLFALAVGGQNERALVRADQDSYFAHPLFPSPSWINRRPSRISSKLSRTSPVVSVSKSRQQRSGISLPPATADFHEDFAPIPGHFLDESARRGRALVLGTPYEELQKNRGKIDTLFR